MTPLLFFGGLALAFVLFVRAINRWGERDEAQARANYNPDCNCGDCVRVWHKEYTRHRGKR